MDISTIWVFPYMVEPPISHPKMMIFRRKTHGPVGETFHHFRKPPYGPFPSTLRKPPYGSYGIFLFVIPTKSAENLPPGALPGESGAPALKPRVFG